MLNVVARSFRTAILFCLAALSLSGCGGGSSVSSSPAAVASTSESSSVPVAPPISAAPAPTPVPAASSVPATTPAPAPEPVSTTAASRFLEQSSFGPTPASVARVQQLGLGAYLDEQFAAPTSTFDDPLSTDVGIATLQHRFFTNALYGQDQLRQRVAFALGQIFVVSGLKRNDPNVFAPYERLLLSHAFGNFYNLLHDVTLSPAMGAYLDMVNNDKPNPKRGNNPNENYAREVLQLFTIGLIKLNPDGTPLLDNFGHVIPTYTQDVIEGFAHVFTGWTYPTKPGNALKVHNPPYFNGAMQVNESNHDNGTKLLLDGVALPAGQTADKDLSDALRNIFQHPNVGPFISFRLIQQLVTSNPSPAYVQRVARLFNDNGQGVRGDLRAVITGILLDSEARRGDIAAQALADEGKLKEPILFVIGLMRALNAQSDGVFPTGASWSMQQILFMPPTVFNYYPPNQTVQGNKLLSPEFKLQNNPGIVARINAVATLLMNKQIPGTTVDLTEWIALAADPMQLVDAVDKRLLRAAMSDAMRMVLVQAVQVIPVSNLGYRAQAALYLAATSSQYSVQR